ncbi:cytochrome p450 [Moniliophthora roreri MCA 2997]|uniref:Cytochrome p450 n=2 Tax=Moniliophthora roreri TaxID=221103 RepID=V2X8I4_MONRO|nr:cytochrome p450 [Moniliophthora roreri MCA 2997]
MVKGQELPLALVVVIPSLLFISFRLVFRRPLYFLPGPPGQRSLLGLEHDFEMDPIKRLHEWHNNHGVVYKLPGCFWTDILVLSDPRALQHILHTSAYGYRKANDQLFFTSMILGKGLTFAEGAAHQKQRKLLNPAFSATQLKRFLLLFQNSTTELLKKVEERMRNGENRVDILRLASKLALDAVGESTFGHRFGAFDGESDDLFTANKIAFVALRKPSQGNLLTRALRRHIPIWLSEKLSSVFQTKDVQNARSAGEVRRKKARDILSQAMQNGSVADEKNKDILSVLVRCNDAEELKQRMTEEEVVAQTTSIMQAGHHVSGATMAWLFYELAKHPEDQERIVDEIKTFRTKLGSISKLTSSDYDAMPYLNAVIKESLRFHSVISLLNREATYDDSIPLTSPIVSTTGENITCIPVKKGQRIMLDVASYHWLKDVWGSDAHQWNPSRFLDPEMKKKQTNIGVFSNILTFSGGVQGCIGWRFALMETQIIVAGVLERFELSLPEGVEIVGVRTAIYVPMLEGKIEEVPLLLKLRRS